jgi:hypothetical protein
MAEALDLQTTQLSVLQRVSRGDVVRDPYPHVVVHDALPTALCQALIEQYPAPEAVGAGPKSNQRWSLPTTDALQSPDVPQVWKDFTRYHASPAFFSEVVDVFGAEIVRLYPKCFPDEGALRRLKLGMRNLDEFEDHDLLLDAQISGNTPVTEPSSVKTVHIDSNNKLFTGLLYLRPPGDDSVGGDLDIVRFRRDLSPGQYRRRYDGMFVDDAPGRARAHRALFDQHARHVRELSGCAPRCHGAPADGAASTVSQSGGRGRLRALRRAAALADAAAQTTAACEEARAAGCRARRAMRRTGRASNGFVSRIQQGKSYGSLRHATARFLRGCRS